MIWKDDSITKKQQWTVRKRST